MDVSQPGGPSLPDPTGSPAPAPASPSGTEPAATPAPPPLLMADPRPVVRASAASTPGPGEPRPPQRGGRTLWVWALALLLFGGLVACGLVVWVIEKMEDSPVSALASGGTSARDNLRETVIEPAPTRDKIAVIDLQGVISGEAIDYEGTTLVTFIEHQLEHAAKDNHVKAVILKIDSPGGEVLASDEIYKLIADFQEEHEKPVVAAMGTIAASGGYYVAAPCRWIVANELTITGSIGVIMHSYNWRGLMDKLGIRPQVFKSGELKDMLSPDKRDDEITGEERRIVQDLVNETFERFKGIVEEGRGLAQARNEDNGGETADQGRRLAKNWQEYADGRLLSGKDAFKLGFVDELGDFDAAVTRARKLAGIENAKVIQYLRPPSFGSLFRLLGRAEETKVKIDLGVPLPRLRAGLYFLAPHLVR